MTADEEYLVGFSTVLGVGPARLNLLIKHYGSAQIAWEAPREELSKIGLPKDALQSFLDTRDKLNVHQYSLEIQKRGVIILTINDPNYPKPLKNIADPPFILYLKGQIPLEKLNEFLGPRCIGVVGTRKMTAYGEEVTRSLVSGLVATGFTIVSGMALGVDGVAHGSALNAGGRTVAVLGAGAEIIYPLAHRELYNRILDSGNLIISEVAPDKGVNKGIFPARNRIISGLSQAVLVTEGAIDSGSLITARCALEQGREVFAVPGPINSAMAEGTNYLIKQGAKLVSNVDDILESLGYETRTVNGQRKNPREVRSDIPDEQAIINLLVNEALDFDELVRRTGKKAAELSSLLAVMEIKKLIVNDRLTYSL